jgi:hypothetical protein
MVEIGHEFLECRANLMLSQGGAKLLNSRQVVL